MADAHAAAGIDDDLLAGAQPFEYLHFRFTGFADRHCSQAGAAALDHKTGPLVATTEQGSHRSFESVRFFPNNNPGFDAKVIPERGAFFGRGEDIGDNVHALFLHPKRGNLQKGGGLDMPDAARERRAALPGVRTRPPRSAQ